MICEHHQQQNAAWQRWPGSILAAEPSKDLLEVLQKSNKLQPYDGNNDSKLIAIPVGLLREPAQGRGLQTACCPAWARRAQTPQLAAVGCRASALAQLIVIYPCPSQLATQSASGQGIHTTWHA